MNPAKQLAASAPAARGMVDVEAEVAWWRRFCARTWTDLDFPDCEPAIRLGIQACLHAHGRSFEDVDPELGDCYEIARQESALDWTHAKAFARASWRRIERSAGRLG